MTSALGDLISPLPLEAFVRDYYPERHVAVHGSLDRLPAFFRSELFVDPRELSKAYRGPIYVTNRGVGRYQLQGAEPRAFFEDLGLSVGFTKMEDLVPGVKEWLRALESELGMPRGMTTMAVFVNAAGSGLSAHCDAQEQIAIHLRGRKTFRVSPHPTRFAKMKHTPGHPTMPEWLGQSTNGLVDVAHLPEDAEQIDLRPGSVFYTPRGLYHETIAGDDIAVTAVLAFRNPTPAELLASYLEKALLQSEEWRRPLEFAWSPDPQQNRAARERMTEMLSRLSPRIATLSSAHLFASAESGVTDAKQLRPDTRLQRDTSTRVVIGEDVNGKLKLEVAHALGTGARTSIALPAVLRPALSWMVERRAPFTFEALCVAHSAWDTSALASVVAFLLRTKALLELPFEAWE